ncbi:MAG: ABC transporter permease, partial [Microbacterium sp.]
METIVTDTTAPRAANTPATATVRRPGPAAGGTPKKPTFWTRLGSAFSMFRNRKSIAGLVILGFFVLVAIFADVLAPYSPTKVDNTARFQPPSAAHWLGTTHIGEDVLSQVIHGTRGVIVVGFLAAIIATVIAIVVGVMSGY